MKRSSLRRRSKKKEQQDEIYKVKRIEFLSKHPWCEVCADEGRKTPSTNVHHVKGRRGNNYLDESTWLPCCSTCHPWKIHFGANEGYGPKWARKNGYLE